MVALHLMRAVMTPPVSITGGNGATSSRRSCVFSDVSSLGIPAWAAARYPLALTGLRDSQGSLPLKKSDKSFTIRRASGTSGTTDKYTSVDVRPINPGITECLFDGFES